MVFSHRLLGSPNHRNMYLCSDICYFVSVAMATANTFTSYTTKRRGLEWMVNRELGKKNFHVWS